MCVPCRASWACWYTDDRIRTSKDSESAVFMPSNARIAEISITSATSYSRRSFQHLILGWPGPCSERRQFDPSQPAVRELFVGEPIEVEDTSLAMQDLRHHQWFGGLRFEGDHEVAKSEWTGRGSLGT